MFTEIVDIYRSNILNNDNRRKLSSFFKVLKIKYHTLKWYEDQLIDILTEGDEIEQFYEESTNFEIVYQETPSYHTYITYYCAHATYYRVNC